KQVSHSHRHTSRRWNPNVQRRKFYLPSEGRTITLTVSPKGLKTIDRDGIESVVAKIRARGEKIYKLLVTIFVQSSSSSPRLAPDTPTSPVRTSATTRIASL